MDEKEIIRLAKQGDRGAFGKLIDRYKKLVYSFAFYHLKNRADAEDISQEVFWRVFSYLSKYDEKRKFFSWIYAIEMNILASYMRKKMKHRKVCINDDFLQNVEFDEKDNMSMEDRILLFQAIDGLNSMEKSLIFMKYNEDCSIREIAESFNISEENVKVRLFRTKEKLGRILGKEALL
jgi:RNA polymerase sigma-70 factor (ECF subfamily)